MKHEWRKKEKNLYIPKEKPVLLEVPGFNYLTISGVGNPNSQAFSDKIGILYSISYAIRMMPKKGIVPEGYFEYTVYPLEGLWDLKEEARDKEVLDKDQLVYTIMIRQPDFVTKDLVKKAIDIARKKGDSPLFNEVKFESIKDGLSVQMLHIGPYDDEAKTFDQMKKFIKEENLQIISLRHREIYLSDFRKIQASKLKTVLRYMVK